MFQFCFAPVTFLLVAVDCLALTATAFGQGVYSARDFSYSANNWYSQPDKDGLKYIIQCSVLVGEYAAGKDDMREPPEKVPGKRYDSTVDNVDDPAIFTVFADYHMYPGYVVTIGCDDYAN